MSYTRLPLTPALSLGEREYGPLSRDQTVPEFAQSLSAKQQSDASCSLSLRVRVRGKCSPERDRRRVLFNRLSHLLRLLRFVVATFNFAKP